MFYYEIWVRTNRYHAKEPLTYSYAKRLPVGSIVSVSLQKIQVNGFVGGVATQPRFKTKTIDHVYNLPPLDNSLVRLAKWLIAYYPSPLGAISQQFLPAKINEPPIEQVKIIPPKKPSPPPLTEEQQNALDKINRPDTYLLHGKTGSGKTRVYTELANRALNSGRSAIILTPEISLTSQLYSVFYQQFGNQVVLIHSKQTPKERQTAWLRCLCSEVPLVVIGPRSAIFSPLKKLGLIIIDEAHENAYKQEQLPHYQTTRVASYLASITRSTLVIGSATPSISDYFMALNKDKAIIKMDELAKKTPRAKTEVAVVDIKDRANFSASSILSDQLIASIKLSLAKNQQSLLYLNRRGTSRIVFCQNCGWEALCPHCSLPMTYHADFHQLRCHTCGYRQDSIPSICPNCDNDAIIFKTVGTKAIVDEISKLFLTAKIGRFDTDNLKVDSMERNYDNIKAGGIDILIGTQLIAKGLDLPKLTTLGVLQADTSLYLPDFSSQERTFQLITQVLGRVNRGHLGGRAIIQTYNPQSKLVQQAIAQDYDSFYTAELEQRKVFKFPPFYHLLKLSCRRTSPKNAEVAANKLKGQLLGLNLGVIIEGPAPAFHEKIQNKFEWQLVVKSTNRKHLTDILDDLPANFIYDIDPVNLL